MRKEKSVVPAQGSCRTFGGERLRKRLWPLWWPKRISLWQFVITADRPFQEYCLRCQSEIPREMSALGT
jgi:hypothetical protein